MRVFRSRQDKCLIVDKKNGVTALNPSYEPKKKKINK